MFIEGYVKIGTRTKELVKYLCNEDIAIIQHDDIDELAAEALINTSVKAVINTGRSMTGSYYSKGTAMLVNSSIKLFESRISLSVFKEKDLVRIKGRDLILNNRFLYSNACLQVSDEYIQRKNLESSSKHIGALSNFIDNTLLYAEKDKKSILDFRNYPDIHTSIKGRYALVVVRSYESREALKELRDFVAAENPILIGVDGGADDIISCGLTPDILIGDMDSVSDVGVYRSKEIVLHAYMDGRCPCLDRVAALNVRYKLLAMPGTSEDIALLLAYDKGAAGIILIGGHSSMNDFLDRGRNGMGSTLLVRLKIGDKLIDYKHIKKLLALTDKGFRENYPLQEEAFAWMKM